MADANGRDKVPLIAKIANPDFVEPPVNLERGRLAIKVITPGTKTKRSHPPVRSEKVPLKVKGTQILKPHTLTFVPCVGWQKGTTFMVEPLHRDAQCQAISGLYRSTNKIAIMNLSDEEFNLNDRHIIAMCERGSEVDEEEHDQGDEVLDPKSDDVPDGKWHRGDQYSWDGNPHDRDEVDETIGKITDQARIDAVINGLKLKENPLLMKHPEIQREAIEMISEYADVFSEDGEEIGVTNLLEFNIDVILGTKPIKQRTRPLNPTHLASLRKQLDRWEKNEVITPSFSPWASPMVAAKKSGGSENEIRWCVDYRALNAVTIPDSYPLPRAQENLEKLSGCRVFSALDSQAAYHCVPV